MASAMNSVENTVVIDIDPSSLTPSSIASPSIAPPSITPDPPSLYSHVAARKPCRTQFIEHAIDEKEATEMYQFLRDTIEWETGIMGRGNKLTRMQKPIDYDEYPELLQLGMRIFQNHVKRGYMILGNGYLNYYQNGEMYTPSHSHQGTHQMVVSFGATRTLKVSSKEYKMTNGSAILFGSSAHGVPREPSVLEGRISFAMFCLPVSV